MLKLMLCCTAILLQVGCGGGTDRPKTFPVMGKVVLKGAPVAQASITFVPEKGRPASGTSNDQGDFSLTTYEDSDGAVLGEHKVLVTKFEPASENDPYAVRKSLIPEKYGDLKTSPLKQSVQDGNNETITIELEE